ncbi:hypothetical protein ILUMI_16184, partial [Ignelater luminosus]
MTNQMETILQALQQQGTALQLLIQQNQHPAIQVPTISQTMMFHNITFESFNPDEESFSAYKERLENFFTLHQLKDNTLGVAEAKRDVLLNCLKSKQYQLLSSLTAPDKPGEKIYDQLVDILQKQFTPVINVHTERHKFLYRIPQSSENSSTYIADLKVIAQKSQFIRGIRDVYIREKILQIEPSTTLQKTLDVALTMEAARKQNLEEYSKDANSGTINKIQIENRSRSQFQSGRVKSYDENQQSCYRSVSRKRSSKVGIINKLGLKNCCLACGKNNHVAAECRSKSKLECSSCKKKGHLAKVCISTMLKQKNQVTDVTVNNIDESNEDYSINSIQYIDFLSSEDRELCKKITIKLQLNGQDQEFELDSGSPVTIISHKDYDKLKINLPIEPRPNIRFRAYNCSEIIHKGVVRVPVLYNDSKSTEILFVVSQDLPLILGRVWIRKLKIIDLDNVNKIEEEPEINANTIIKESPTVFDGKIGEVPNTTSALKLRDEAKPVYIKPRP